MKFLDAALIIHRKNGQMLIFWGNELTLRKSEHKLHSEIHNVDMGKVRVPHFGVHLSRKDFNALKNRLAEKCVKYHDNPQLRFKETKYDQETFFIKDINETILEINTLMANPGQFIECNI